MICRRLVVVDLEQVVVVQPQVVRCLLVGDVLLLVLKEFEAEGWSHGFQNLW